jgi:hypothetical protein
MFSPAGSFEDLQQKLEVAIKKIDAIEGTKDIKQDISTISSDPFLQQRGHSKIAHHCTIEVQNLLDRFAAQRNALENEHPCLDTMDPTFVKFVEESGVNVAEVVPVRVVFQYKNTIQNINVLNDVLDTLNHIVQNYCLTEKDVHSVLFHYCSWNKPDDIIKLLDKCPTNVDLLEDDGEYFNIALSKGYVEVFMVLMDYYEETMLQKDKDSAEYQLNRHNLQVVLSDLTEKTELPEEIVERLISYGIGSESTDTDQDLSDDLDMLELGTSSINALWTNLNHGQDYQDHLLLHDHNTEEGQGVNLLGNHHGTIHTQ